jgi:omega-6 fatty acid desaturase (delta-12 desaturase)
MSPSPLYPASSCIIANKTAHVVAITYLHHTHPEVHHFEAESWTFVKGALATVDRDFGFVGRHLFHGIIDTHVVHHLFP